MTVPYQIDPECLASVFAGGALEIRWTAAPPARTERGHGLPGVRSTGPDALAFVVSIQPVDGRHALLDAWMETETGSRSVIARQPVSCTISVDGDLVHVDVYREDRRIVATSMTPASPAAERRLLYARTTLLGPAGLHPGAYDPPTARLLARATDAASA